ncbi:unnamed protein product [Durusdinium trenchii]|uniref:Uncharacterized protein n=1 Tax=Durusdinium trenchii TaxID=1381693 RepID=A0ABP0HEU0_9DINO
MKSHPADTASCPSRTVTDGQFSLGRFLSGILQLMEEIRRTIRFFLLWLWPLLREGAKRPLKEEDIYEIPRPLRAEALDPCWHRNIGAKTGHTSILWLLLRTFGWRYIFILFTFTFWLSSLSMVPLLTDTLFQWLATGDSTLEGLAWSMLLVGSYLVNCNSACQWYQQTTRLGCELRASAAMMVFRRSLQLRVQDTNRDAALNLLQVDTERLYIFAQLNHLIYVALVVVTVSMIYLRMQQCSDQRISLTAEILDAVKVLKMYGWTDALQRRVEEIRNRELRHARVYLGIRAFSSALLYSSPSLSMASVLLMMYLQGKELSAERVFIIFTTIGLSRAPLGGVSMGVTAVVDGLTAFRRLSGFVAQGHFDLYQEDLLGQPDKPVPTPGLDGCFECARVSGCFSHRTKPCLSVELELKPGELVAVCGKVAAGKSSLLLALLGEMQGGHSNVPSGVAYLAQSPWIRSGTVREAVVQELPFEKKHYWRAVRAAQLLPDFRAWKGDGHPVGARGATLSGGQRARLGLAQILYRCLVSDVNLVLLDDCLAAVDVHVAKAICEEALLGVLLDGQRTVVMVMNSSLLALPEAHRIVHLAPSSSSASECESGAPSSAQVFPSLEAWHTAVGDKGLPPKASKIQRKWVSDEEEAFEADAGAVLEKAEVSMLGRLSWKTLTYYFGSGRPGLGLGCLACILTSMASVEALRVYSDHFMAVWADRDSLNSEEDSSKDFQTYGAWMTFALVGAFLRAWLVVALALRSSRELHTRLFGRLMAASLDFFESTPRGRILGHFSKDIDAVDALLPQYLLDFLQDITMLLGIVVVCVSSTPVAAVAVAPVLFAFYRIRSFFSCTARETKRLDGVTRGPLYSAVGDVADGLATLRAHRQQRSLVQDFQKILDRNGKVFFQTSVLQPWCILVLDSLGSAIVLITSVFCVFLRADLEARTSTMAISYALMTRGKLQFCIRLSIETENQFVAAERLQIFEAQLLSSIEAHPEVKEVSMPVEWPQGGAIDFQEVKMHYQVSSLEPVLKGLSLKVKAGQKVGLVGRTGSGKSSLLSALLRIVEVTSGKILVDGLNIAQVPVARLRAAISLVPQEPILWSGSMAENLDPSGRIGEEELVEALHKVHLHEMLAPMGGIAAAVEMRGNNFSLGQRQLICIARCIARSSRIVLVDEATSCVDGQTDALIQEAFQKDFKNCTMLVVAHRLQTVMDSDLIAVLDSGRVVETGHPESLAAQKSSHFAGLLRGSHLAL